MPETEPTSYPAKHLNGLKTSVLQKQLYPGIIFQRHYNMPDRNLNTIELLNMSGL